VLRFRDAETDVNVVLIGTMHYNPVSIATVERLIEDHRADQSLKAVVIESCPARWNVSKKDKVPPRGASLYTKLLYNEMLAAADAVPGSIPIVLGDAPIEVIGKRVRELGLSTLRQVSDFPNGWYEVWKDFSAAVGRATEKVTMTEGRTLGAKDFLDFPLLLAMPVSIARYCTAIMIKGPNALRIPLLFFFGMMLFHTDAAANEGFSAVSSAPMEVAEAANPFAHTVEAVGDLVGSTLFAAAETMLLGRVFLVGLLEERNVILAKSIREACAQNKPTKPWVELPEWLGPQKKRGPTIIAVLGMAHCNGVQQILLQAEQNGLIDAEVSAHAEAPGSPSVL